MDQVDGYQFDGEYLLVAKDGEDHRTRTTRVAFLARGKFWVNNHAHIVRGNPNEPPSLLRNDVSGSRNWLKVLLVGTKSNRSAIGSRVTARYDGKVQAQTVTAQSSFYSVNDRRLHFGLGKAQTCDLEVRWTNGGTEKIPGVSAGQLVVIKEEAGIVKVEKWARHS